MEASETTSPVVQRRRLRTELRRARLDAGLTQEQVATAMEWSLSKLIRIENGSVGISLNDLKAILSHYKITDEKRTAELIALSRGARARSWWSDYRDVPPRLVQLIEEVNPGVHIAQEMMANPEQVGLSEPRIDHDLMSARAPRQANLTLQAAPPVVHLFARLQNMRGRQLGFRR